MNKKLTVLISMGLLHSYAATVICLEAETAKMIEAPMVKVEAAAVPKGVTLVKGASAGAYLEIPEGKGNPPKVTTGKAVYEIDIPADGEYVLWARVYWDGECSNSFGVKVGENKAFSFGQDATYKTWHWVRSPRRLKQLRFKKGKTVITFENREDGVRVDQIALSSNTRWVPVGVEKLRP